MKKIFKKIFGGKKVKLVTHDGSFHCDDIFAAATISMYLEKKAKNFNIIRSRDEKIIQKGDYVFDVGGVYDEKENRFDHHQKGGAGRRPGTESEGQEGVSIEYASFGLVWKKLGQELSGSKEVADIIDRKLVSPVDARDNGIDLFNTNFKDISPYTINDVFATFANTSLENFDKDKQFLKALLLAKEILKREIKKTTDEIKIKEIIFSFYDNAIDKKIIIIDKPRVSRHEISDAFKYKKDILFVVYGDEADWSVLAMKDEISSFKNKKDLPVSWAGLKDADLQKVTGVSDAVFCHRGLFLAVAKSKEGAIKLAQIAVQS